MHVIIWLHDGQRRQGVIWSIMLVLQAYLEEVCNIRPGLVTRSCEDLWSSATRLDDNSVCYQQGIRSWLAANLDLKPRDTWNATWHVGTDYES